MKLIVDDKSFKFIAYGLNHRQENYTNAFAAKNNKTLGETLSHLMFPYRNHLPSSKSHFK